MTNTLAAVVADVVAEQIAIADKALNSAYSLLQIPEVKAIVAERMAEGSNHKGKDVMLSDIACLGDFGAILKSAVGRGDLI